MRTISAAITAFALLAALPSAGAEEPEPLPPDAPVVLHVGDSFVHVGFAQTLKPKFREAGARYVVRAKHSLYTPTIINGLRLPDLMRNHKPSLVILNIGGNEMRMPRPSDHAAAIRRVSEVVSRGQASCVWVTPPPPVERGETGIVGIIKEQTAPCRVFDSTPLAQDLERETFDKVHPTRKAGAKWAEVFWGWLEKERDPSQRDWKLKPRPPSKAAPADEDES
ncbi:MAG: SGNH/GDSL hydrolase family protein [Myxococcota bacterium]